VWRVTRPLPPSAVADRLPDATTRPEVVVRSSTRRRKTAGAHLEGGRIVVVVPAGWPARVRDQVVEDLVGRLVRRRPAVAASDGELAARAGALADRYLDGTRPASIRWVTNQSSRWGSCTTATGVVRISDRLRGVPGWVLDAVLVHELAHLVEPDHSRRFDELVSRYPRTRDAGTFLDGFAAGLRYRDEHGVNPPGEADCTVQTV
jgi:hypothetical protein